MENYILDRLRADSINLLNHSDNQESIKHPGLRGRFRELLINDILIPWLPPYVSCGTGTIIDSRNMKRKFTQDDIILFDKSLTPPVLYSRNSEEGIFLHNSVLARIEVKSTVTKQYLKNFCISSLELSKFKFATWPKCSVNFITPFNLIFSYKSDSNNEDENFELKRFINVMKEVGIEPLSGIVPMICIAGRGLWKLGERDGTRIWQRLNSNKPEDHISWFVGCVSNACFEQHLLRQGRETSKSLECGIGTYISGNNYLDIDINAL